MEGPTPSPPQIAEPALADDRQQLADDGQQLADDGQQWADDGQQQADDSMDSNDGEYEDNDGQSEVSEEEENGENDEDDDISKKTIYVRRTQPASGQIASARCVPCALTVRRTFFLIPLSWCLPTPLSPLPCTQRACCGHPAS